MGMMKVSCKFKKKMRIKEVLEVEMGDIEEEEKEVDLKEKIAEDLKEKIVEEADHKLLTVRNHKLKKANLNEIFAIIYENRKLMYLH